MDASIPLLAPFSLGYVKGQSRMNTLQAILHVLYTKSSTGQPCNLEAIHHKFWESCRTVSAHPLNKGSKLDEALANMKISAQGSIRKQNSVIQIVVICQNLSKYGLNDYLPGLVINIKVCVLYITPGRIRMRNQTHCSIWTSDIELVSNES